MFQHLRVFFAGMLLVMGATALLAQVQMGQITGMVTDPTNAVIPAATVTAKAGVHF